MGAPIPDPALARVVRRVVHSLTDTLDARAEEFLAVPGVEEVHRLRVATRRTRALLAFLRPAGDSRMTGARRDLTVVARELGALRDVDVLLARLDDPASALVLATGDRARRGLTRRRADLAATALRTVAAPGWTRALERVHRSVAHRHLDPDLAARPAAEVVPVWLAAWWDGLAPAWGELADLTPARRHRVRIRTKRLRYALEECADVVDAPPELVASVLADLEDVQDALGALNDARVAADLLASVGAGAGAGAGGSVGDGAGARVGAHESQIGGTGDPAGTVGPAGTDGGEARELDRAVAACARLLGRGSAWLLAGHEAG